MKISSTGQEIVEFVFLARRKITASTSLLLTKISKINSEDITNIAHTVTELENGLYRLEFEKGEIFKDSEKVKLKLTQGDEIVYITQFKTFDKNNITTYDKKNKYISY